MLQTGDKQVEEDRVIFEQAKREGGIVRSIQAKGQHALARLAGCLLVAF